MALVTRAQFDVDTPAGDLVGDVPEAEVIKALEVITCGILAAVYRDQGAVLLEQVGLLFAGTGSPT